MLPTTFLISLQVLLHPIVSAAYTWQLNSVPRQCSDISITVTGSDGQPPYSVLVVPYGPSPFSSQIDVRTVIDKTFNGDSKSISLPINYPAGSQFVAVVSDASGFGTGGTSAPTQVAQSGDNGCFNVSQTWIPHFWFFIGPTTQPAAEVVQCNTTRIWWNNTADVEGAPAFVGVIPDGQSFPIIPESNIFNTSDEGIGFTWVPRVRAGTPILIVAGDSRGLGTGGSGQFTVAHSDNATCVSDISPSTTPGTPAGSIKKASKIPVIVGAFVGGVIGLIVLVIAILYFRHRRKETKILGTSMTSGLLSDYRDAPNNDVGYHPNRIAPYRIETLPYRGPANHEDANSGSDIQPTYRLMGSNSSVQVDPDDVSSSGPGLTDSPSMQAPNISVIQHEDSGSGRAPGEVPTTINLPPRYDTLGGRTGDHQWDHRRGKPAAMFLSPPR